MVVVDGVSYCRYQRVREIATVLQIAEDVAQGFDYRRRIPVLYDPERNEAVVAAAGIRHVEHMA